MPAVFIEPRPFGGLLGASVIRDFSVTTDKIGRELVLALATNDALNQKKENRKKEQHQHKQKNQNAEKRSK